MEVRPPDPPLTDGVVTLRPWGEQGDVERIVDACNDPAIAEFLDLIPQPYTPSDAVTYIEACRNGWLDGSVTNFAIVVDAAAVGSLGVRQTEEPGVAEIGYWVAAAARGQGVCTRAVRLVSRWLLEDRELARVQLRADEENVPSKRVAENAGFTREGVLRSSHYNRRRDRRVDFVMYSLLPGEL
ncbi:MAG TPA: GNAT family N-acetyltransferase [Gaiellaceae bacterium]|jgi:RimJ/RimL family protein N-acetyltransferase